MFGVLDYVKIAGGIAIGILLTSVYWLGIPLLNDYPVLKRIPLIGPLAVGHVEVVKADALEGYVIESEKAASDALVKKLQRDILLGQQIREQADKASEQLDIEDQKRREADEKAIADNKGGASRVTRDDLDRIERVRKSR